MLRTGADPTGGGAPYPLKAPAVCVVGSTASGKTDLAQALALELGGEVISADSMQIYRGMDIGTGKLPASERLVPHHGFDLVDPGEPFSAALFQNYARDRFRAIDARGNRCVLAGGTGFYVRAAVDDYDFPAGEQVGNPVRERYQALAREQGAEALWKLLAARDEASASVIPPADVKRVVRAFELLEEGTTYAEQRARLAHIPQLVPAVFFGMAVDPDVLCARIGPARVDAMVETGLVAEVEGAARQGLSRRRNGAAGYQVQKEIVGGSRQVPLLTRLWSGSSWPRAATRSGSAPGFARTRVSGGSMRRRAIFRRSSKKRSSCLMTALPDGFSRRRNACDMIRSHGHTPAVEPFKIGAPIMQTAHAFL